MVYTGHSSKGAALTKLILASFPFHGALMAAGERLTALSGLTSARWQVLSVIARAERPETVANIARNMGLTRQAVQRVANDLAATGLVAFAPNPHHKRAVLVMLTATGQARFQEMSERQVPWANALADHLNKTDVDAAACVLGELAKLFEHRVGEP